MNPTESKTVQSGFAIVLAALSVGLQFGQWPEWTIVVAVLGFFAWTVLYAEVEIRLGRILRSSPESEAHPA